MYTMLLAVFLLTAGTSEGKSTTSAGGWATCALLPEEYPLHQMQKMVNGQWVNMSYQEYLDEMIRCQKLSKARFGETYERGYQENQKLMQEACDRGPEWDKERWRRIILLDKMFHDGKVDVEKITLKGKAK